MTVALEMLISFIISLLILPIFTRPNREMNLEN